MNFSVYIKNKPGAANNGRRLRAGSWDAGGVLHEQSHG